MLAITSVVTSVVTSIIISDDLIFEEKEEEKEEEEVKKEEDNEDDELSVLMKELCVKRKKKKKIEKIGIMPKQIIDTKEDYMKLLQKAYEQIKLNNPDLYERKTVSIHPPQLLKLGKRKVMWINFNSNCNQVKRSNDHLSKYIFEELSCRGSIDSQFRLIIKEHVTHDNITTLFRKYINKYVKCSSCNSLSTNLYKLNKIDTLICNNCHCAKTINEKSMIIVYSGQQSTMKKLFERYLDNH